MVCHEFVLCGIGTVYSRLVCNAHFRYGTVKLALHSAWIKYKPVLTISLAVRMSRKYKLLPPTNGRCLMWIQKSRIWWRSVLRVFIFSDHITLPCIVNSEICLWVSNWWFELQSYEGVCCVIYFLSRSEVPLLTHVKQSSGPLKFSGL